MSRIWSRAKENGVASSKFPTRPGEERAPTQDIENINLNTINSTGSGAQVWSQATLDSILPIIARSLTLRSNKDHHSKVPAEWLTQVQTPEGHNSPTPGGFSTSASFVNPFVKISQRIAESSNHAAPTGFSMQQLQAVRTLHVPSQPSSSQSALEQREDLHRATVGTKRSNEEAVKYSPIYPPPAEAKVHRHDSADVTTRYQNGMDNLPGQHPVQHHLSQIQPGYSENTLAEFVSVKNERPVSVEMPQIGIKGNSSASSLEQANQAAVNASSGANNNVRWNSWSHEEEVFLVVSVLDRFFRRGSLASATKGAANGSDCWADIKNMYDRICAAWHGLPENKIKPSLINRSTSALCRHFKIMKVRAAEGDVKGTKQGNFRKYLREWDNSFNLDGRLIPEDL